MFDINSGSAYVDPDNCMLSFTVNLTADTPQVNDAWSFGTGTGANLFTELRILSKNGCEVDRTQNLNVLSKILIDYTFNGEGEQILQGAGKGVSLVTGAGGTGSLQVVIPMCLLSGFFRPTVKGMKIPSGLASGLRLEFLTARPGRAFTRTAGTGTGLTYTITDPQMLFMSSELNDPTQSTLMSESASNGLEYTFPSYFSTNVTTSSSQLTEQVKKAVSMCTRIFTTVYDAAEVVKETVDGFASLPSSAIKSWQYRVGSSYYPQKVVADNSVESWYLSLACFNKLRDVQTNPPNIGLLDFNANGKSLYAMPLETDSLLNLSGIPLNNSSVAELRMELDTVAPNDVAKDCVIFIEFSAVARTFINRTSLKI